MWSPPRRTPAGLRNRAATPGQPKNAYSNTKMGTAFVNAVIEDTSRVVYAEIHNDDRQGIRSWLVGGTRPSTPDRPVKYHRNRGRAAAQRREMARRCAAWPACV